MNSMDSKFRKMRAELFKGVDQSKIPLQDVDYPSITANTSSFIVSQIKQLCKFIGSRNVFIELQGPIFDKIYIPSVKESLLKPKLDEFLRPFIESTCELGNYHISFFSNIFIVPDEHAVDAVLKETFSNMVLALSIAILDGGKLRIFYPTDAELLFEDLKYLENFFHADGHGISNYDYILRTTARIKGNNYQIWK